MPWTPRATSACRLYFFGANAAYWKVRLSDPGADGNARVVTCYKREPQKDPLAGTPRQTGRFRDDPINEPEEQLVGTMYESWMLFGVSWTVRDVSHAMYEGTGLHAGDSIPQLVGYEYDRTFELDTPSPVTVLARSGLIDAEGKPGVSESTIYTAPSGALVFGAGSIYWPLGLDGPQRDARVERMTANLLKLGIQLPVPSALQSVSAPFYGQPDPNWASSVRTVASGMPGPAGVAQLPDGTFVIADPRANRIWRTDGTGRWWAYAGDGNPDGNPSYDNVPGLGALLRADGRPARRRRKRVRGRYAQLRDPQDRRTTPTAPCSLVARRLLRRRLRRRGRRRGAAHRPDGHGLARRDPHRHRRLGKHGDPGARRRHPGGRPRWPSPTGATTSTVPPPSRRSTIRPPSPWRRTGACSSSPARPER